MCSCNSTSTRTGASNSAWIANRIRSAESGFQVRSGTTRRDRVVHFPLDELELVDAADLTHAEDDADHGLPLPVREVHQWVASSLHAREQRQPATARARAGGERHVVKDVVPNEGREEVVQTGEDKPAGFTGLTRLVVRVEHFRENVLGVQVQAVAERARRREVAGFRRAVEVLHRHAEAGFDSLLRDRFERLADALNRLQPLQLLPAFGEHPSEELQVGRQAGHVIRVDLAQPGELPARVLPDVHDVRRAGLHERRKEVNPVRELDPGQQFRHLLARHRHEPDRRQPLSRVEAAPLQVAQEERTPQQRLAVRLQHLDRHTVGAGGVHVPNLDNTFRRAARLDVAEVRLIKFARQQWEPAELLHT